MNLNISPHPKYNKFTNEIIYNNIQEKELAKKYNISTFIDNTNLDNKIATLRAKLRVEQDKIVKLQAFDSIYFRGKGYFEDSKLFSVPANLKRH